MSAKIRVVLADDHVLVRTGFRMLLQGTADIEVVGEAATGEDACREWLRVQPDVLVLDISMPAMGGLEALARIMARDAHARVLVLSAHDDPIHPARALAAGAAGYLTKRGAPEELVHAIREVARGNTFVEAAIAQDLAAARVRGGGNPTDVLSPREFQVFLALAAGKSAASIADAMSLSPSTVGTHLYNIKQKLGASNASELTLIAVRSGLIRG